MNQTEITEMLEQLRIPWRIKEHPAAETIEQIERFQLPGAETIVKNLFLRDDKKRKYYLVVVRKDKTVNLKELRQVLASRPLSFASENDLQLYLDLKKGAVTPLGLLSDSTHSVSLVLDADILKYSEIGVHPNANTATLWLSPQDLKSLIEKHGNPVLTVNM